MGSNQTRRQEELEDTNVDARSWLCHFVGNISKLKTRLKQFQLKRFAD